MNRAFVEVAIVLVLVMAIAIAQAAVPPIMSYQGRLTDLAGQNVTDGNYTVRFTIYDAAMAVWAETLSVSVSDGLFAATFGQVHPLPSTLFANPDLWLGMKVGADPEITPRTRLTTVAYAFASDNGGVAYLPLTGGTMTGPITSTGEPAITMGKGNFGFANANAGSWAFVAGINNDASGSFSAVGGGVSNTASGSHAVISGGYSNEASGSYAKVGGGNLNQASAYGSTVGGGQNNAATGNRSTVGGGVDNQADGDYSFAAGNNCVVAAWAEGAVAVGMNNTANAPHAVALGNGCGSYGIGSFTVGESAQTISGANYSVAMGRRPSASEPGQFVFADSIDAVFGAFTPNGFHVRASGGVGLGTGSPDGRALVVDNQFTGAGNVLLDLNASVDITVSGRDALQIEVGGSATDIQYIECERGSDIEFRVNGDGNVTADGTFTGGGADFAELVRISTGFASVSPGDVMVIDPANPQSFVRTDSPRSTLVAGVFSTQPGFMASERDWDEIQIGKTGVAAPSAVSAELPGTPIRELAAQIDEVPLAIVGIVPCKVSAENGPIRVGDLLVTSATPGHAMRDDNPRPGTIVGKALASLESGTGIIKVLVTLQ